MVHDYLIRYGIPALRVSVVNVDTLIVAVLLHNLEILWAFPVVLLSELRWRLILSRFTPLAYRDMPA